MKAEQSKRNIQTICKALLFPLATTVALLHHVNLLGVDLIGSFQLHSQIRTVSFHEDADTVLVGTTTGIHKMTLDEVLSYKETTHSDRVALHDYTSIAGIPYQLIGTDDGFVYYQSVSLIYVDKLDDEVRNLSIAEPPIRFLASSKHQLLIKNALVSADTVLKTDIEEGISSADLSADGALAAAGIGDGTVKIWDAASGLPVTTLNLETFGYAENTMATSLAFSKTHDVLLIGTNTGELLAVTTMDWTSLWDAKQSEQPIIQIRFQEDSQSCFSMDSSSVESRSLQDGSKKHKWTSTAGQFIDFDVESSGDRIMAASDTQHITLWSTSTGAALFHYDAHHAAAETKILDISTDNTKVALQAAKNYVQIWDVPSMQMDVEFQMDELRTPRLSAKLSESGAIGLFKPKGDAWPSGASFRPSEDHHLIADTTTGEELLEAELIPVSQEDHPIFKFVDLAPDGKHILMTGEGSLFEVTISAPERENWEVVNQSSDTYRHNHASYTSDGKYILIDPRKVGDASLWINTTSGSVTEIPRYSARVKRVVAPDSSIMIAGPVIVDKESFVIMWDLETGESASLDLMGTPEISSITPLGFIGQNVDQIIARVRFKGNSFSGRAVIDLTTNSLIHYVEHGDFNQSGDSDQERGKGSSDGRYWMANDHLWDLKHGVMLEVLPEGILASTVKFFHSSPHFMKSVHHRIEIYSIPEAFEMPRLQYSYDSISGDMRVHWQAPASETVVLQSSHIVHPRRWKTVAAGSATEFHVNTKEENALFFRLHFTKE